MLSKCCAWGPCLACLLLLACCEPLEYWLVLVFSQAYLLFSMMKARPKIRIGHFLCLWVRESQLYGSQTFRSLGNLL